MFLVRTFVLAFIGLVGLNNAYGMKEEFISKKEMVDHSSSEFKTPQAIAVTDYGDNHDLLMVGCKDGSVRFILRNKKTNLTACIQTVLIQSAPLQHGVTSLDIDQDSKQLLVVCENQIYTIDVTEILDFSFVNADIPMIMVSFPCENGTTFRAYVTTDGIGSFGLFNKEKKVSVVQFRSSQENSFVSTVDVLRISDEKYLIAFAFQNRTQFVYWEKDKEPKLLESNCGLSNNVAVAKIDLNKEKQQIGLLSVESNDFLYLDFTDEIKKLLLV